MTTCDGKHMNKMDEKMTMMMTTTTTTATATAATTMMMMTDRAPETPPSNWNIKRITPFTQPSDMPDSPDRQDSDLYYLNSDDLVQTSDVGYSPADHTPRALVIVGSREKTITLGRGGASTVKIGRRNRQISRIHVSIEHNPTKDSFELVVLGLNGATVDNVLYGQHERAELSQDSMIDVLGDIILFKEPPPLCEAGDEEEVMEEEEHMYEEEEEVAEDQEHEHIHEHVHEHEYEYNHDNKHELEHEEEEEDEVVENEDLFGDHLELSSMMEGSEMDKLEELEDLSMLSAVYHDDEDEEILERQKGQEMVEYEEEEDQEDEKPVNQKISRKFLIEEDEDEDEEDEEKNVVQNTRRQRQRPRQEEDEESDDDEEAEVKAEEDKKEEKQCVEKETDYSEIIIDALVFSRKSSMPMSDICSRIMKTNPTYRQQPRELWMSRIQHVLQICPFFGEIVRKGKTADGSPKENLYYYSSDKDPVEWRRTAYTQVGRSARKCTLQDKQYFWRIPPKLGRHRGTYIPPPAKDYYEPNNTSKRTNKSEEAEENSRKKSKHNSTN